MNGRVDLIIYNASVLADGAPQGRARAVAVKDGRIAAIGDDKDVLALAGVQTKVVDGRNMALLPGFVDAHVHLLGFAETFLGVDCSPSRTASMTALQALIRERAAEIAPGHWIRAYGYHQFFLDEGRHPTRWDLDAAAPRHPVRLLHQNRHICVLNSLALRAAGITRRTPSPLGGLVEKDAATGEPTGLLVGMSMWVARHVVPPLGPDELKEGIRLASQSFLSQGVTCLHDASPRNGVDEWHLYGGLVKDGDLPLRVRMMIGLDSLDGALEEGLGPRCGSAYLKLGAVKIVVEQIGDRLYPSPRELAAQVQKAHNAGFQVAIHAIAPKAIRAAIGAMKSLGDGEGRKFRHRLEHCTYLPPDLIGELAEIGVTVVSQPSFLFFNGSRYLVEVPAHKFPWVCRGRSLLRKGVPLVGSTDAPVVPNSIMAGVDAAVSRESQVGFVFGPRERVSAAQGLSLFTAAGAYASFEEHEMGSVKVGSYADLVVLDKDPLEVRPEEIRNIRPEMAVVGGRVAWVREG